MRIFLHGRLKCCCVPLLHFPSLWGRTVQCSMLQKSESRIIRQYAGHVNPPRAVRRYVSLLLKLPIRRCILLGRSCFPSILTSITLLFNLRWISLPFKQPETPRSTRTHTASHPQYVTGIAHESKYANQCQDFDGRSFFCREDEPSLALHGPSVASRTCGCRNSWC